MALNGVPIMPTVYAGASVSGESIFVADNQYASLSAGDIGEFGISSFGIEVKAQARAVRAAGGAGAGRQ